MSKKKKKAKKKNNPNLRPCTCGSGEPWTTCQGIDGDWSHCG